MCVQGSWFQAVNTFSSSLVWIQIIGLTHIYGFFSQRLTQSKHLTSQIFVLYKTMLLWGNKLNPLLSKQETETHKSWDLPKVMLKTCSRPSSRTEGPWISGHRWGWFTCDSHQWNFTEIRPWLWAWLSESRIRGPAVECGQLCKHQLTRACASPFSGDFQATDAWKITTRSTPTLFAPTGTQSCLRLVSWLHSRSCSEPFGWEQR